MWRKISWVTGKEVTPKGLHLGSFLECVHVEGIKRYIRKFQNKPQLIEVRPVLTWRVILRRSAHPSQKIFVEKYKSLL